MEGKDHFGAKYEENITRSDCRMKVQGMSNSFMHECVEIAWDDFFLDDDRIVPHHGSKSLHDHFTLGEGNKRSRGDLAGIPNTTGGSATKCVDHDKEKSGIAHLNKTRSTMLEKDSWSGKLNGPTNYNELINEASSLACDNTMLLPHGSKSNNRNSNNGDLVKHSTTIQNNKAKLVDDSTFNSPIGGLNYTGNYFFENAENKDSSDLLYYHGWSEIENFDDIDKMFRSDSTLGLGDRKDDELSWLSSADDIGGSGDALRSGAKYMCPDPNETSEHNKKINFQSRSAEQVQQHEHALASNSDSCLEDPISNIHLMGNHVHDPSSVNIKQSIIKSETNGSMAIQASTSYPGLVGKYESHNDPLGASSANEVEMDSSNKQENSATVPDLDISLEATSFHQLQLITRKLDLRTKICIRDSLYRLAQSAEQRCGNQNLNGGCGDERDANVAASEAEGATSCTGSMDMETDTNPIDRSVAQLLFHRPSDSPNTHFQSPIVVHWSAASPAVFNLASEEC